MNFGLPLKKNLFMKRCNLFHKIKMLLVLPGILVGVTAFSQTTVTGKVTSADSVLSDVTVAVKNGTAATKTNASGDFSIIAAQGDMLVFTYVGFTTQEVKLTKNTLINISLVSQSRQLNDVVVVGYGTQRKGSITGAVSSIKSADLVRTPSSTVSSALVGKIQGVTARQATGRPGAGTTLQIRNLGAPLYVIDGVPQSEGQFNNIGMEDIENISVLKDASASLYGFRASNGVVLVTTKKGKSGMKNSLTVSSYYQVQNLTRYISASGAGDYVRALAEAEQNAGLTPTTTPEILEKWRQGTEKGYESSDYRDYILRRNAPQKYLNISSSGGNDKMNYYISVGGLKQDAVLKQYNFKRYNFQANVEGTVVKGVKFGAQLSGRIESRHEPASTTGIGVTYDNPFLAILTMWPTEHLYANDNPNYINADVNNPSRNPLIYNENVIGKQDNTWNTFGGIFYTTFALPFGITAKATYSYTYKQNKNELQRNSFNTYSYKPATDTYVPVPFNLALRNKARQEIKENFVQFQLNYNKDLGNHSISAMGAYEYAGSTDQLVSVTAIPPTNYTPLINLLNINGFSDTWVETKRASFIGRLNYSYKRRYLLELLGRYDGSHLYAPGKRWGLFPGISAGWRINEEKFFAGRLTKNISNLKLRASWGRTGQERGVLPYDYLPGGNFGTGSYVLDGGLTTGIGVRGLPITNISWVTSTIKNIGLDIGMFNNKLTAEFDVFQRDLTGIPAPRYDVLLPSEVGYTLPAENLNAERTMGIEGIITWSSKAGKVGYTISGNATLGRRKIMNLYKPRFGNSWDQYRNQTDNRWADIHWGYQVEGQFQSVQEIKEYKINNDGQGNKTLLPGDFKFKDVNGDGLISNLDERPIGYAVGDGSTAGAITPYMSFGFTASVNYKGFSVTTDWSGATMQSYYRIFELAIPFQAIHNAPEYIFNDRWHRADVFDPNSAWIPGKYPPIRRTGSGSHVDYTTHSDFWITNVHYIRLKNLDIGYTFPKNICGKIGLSNLRIYLSGTNLFSFDNLRDVQVDPEISMNSGLVYPTVKLYTFGINLTL